jgi:DNA-binding MarR family transcriptional regulator
MPRAGDSHAEMVRALDILVSRKQMQAYFQRISTEAGIELPAGECWLLAQARRQGSLEVGELVGRLGAHRERIQCARADLITKGLLAIKRGDCSEDERVELTAAGREAADRVVACVRRRLQSVLDGWSPEQHSDLVQLLNEFAAEVVPASQLLRHRNLEVM